MIKIHVSTSADLLVRSGFSYAFTDYGVSSPTLKRTLKITPLFFIKASISPEPVVVKPPLFTGPPSRYHEKACIHPNISGSLLIDENVKSTEGSTPDSFIYKNMEHWPLVVWGEDQTFSCVPTYTKNSVNPLYRYFRVSFVSEFCCVTAMITPTIDHRFSVALRSVGINAIKKKFSQVSKGTFLFGSLEEAKAFTDDLSEYAIVPNGYLTAYPGSPGTQNPSDVALSLFGQCQRLGQRMEIFAPNAAEWGEMAFSAVNSERYVDTNGLQFFTEMTTLKGAFSTILGGAKSVKAASRAYLAWQYGYQSQKRDMASYTKGLKRYMQDTRGDVKIARASFRAPRGNDITVTCFYKVRWKARSETILQLYHHLDKWSLYPNMTTAWDLVPFSFVFDWFTDFSSLLEKMDHNTRVSTYDVLEVVRSYSVTDSSSFLFMLMGYPDSIAGSLSIKYYVRQVKRGLDKPKFTLTPPSTFGSIPEALALIISLW